MNNLKRIIVIVVILIFGSLAIFYERDEMITIDGRQLKSISTKELDRLAKEYKERIEWKDEFSLIDMFIIEDIVNYKCPGFMKKGPLIRGDIIKFLDGICVIQEK